MAVVLKSLVSLVTSPVSWRTIQNCCKSPGVAAVTIRTFPLAAQASPRGHHNCGVIMRWPGWRRFASTRLEGGGRDGRGISCEVRNRLRHRATMRCHAHRKSSAGARFEAQIPPLPSASLTIRDASQVEGLMRMKATRLPSGDSAAAPRDVVRSCQDAPPFTGTRSRLPTPSFPIWR